MRTADQNCRYTDIRGHTVAKYYPLRLLFGTIPGWAGGKEVLVRAECVRQRNEVAIKLGIISLSSSSLSLSSSRRLLKTIEGGVVGF